MIEWTEYIRPFVDALISLYPEKEALIRATASEDTGPTLADYDAYGVRLDTGARVNGMPVWCYERNGVHVCETEPGSKTVFRWVENDPEFATG